MLPFTCTMVDSDAHTCWPSYHVLKMRESLESSGPSTSRGDTPPANSHPTISQSRSGVGPAFCSDRGGTPYASDVTACRRKLRARWLLSRDRVLTKVQNPSTFERPTSLAVSSAAVELTKNSVPPSAFENTPAGEFAGMTVKPGIACGLGFNATLENCTTCTFLAPEVSAFFEMA